MESWISASPGLKQRYPAEQASQLCLSVAEYWSQVKAASARQTLSTLVNHNFLESWFLSCLQVIGLNRDIQQSRRSNCDQVCLSLDQYWPKEKAASAREKLSTLVYHKSLESWVCLQVWGLIRDTQQSRRPNCDTSMHFCC